MLSRSVREERTEDEVGCITGDVGTMSRDCRGEIIRKFLGKDASRMMHKRDVGVR